MTSESCCFRSARVSTQAPAGRSHRSTIPRPSQAAHWAIFALGCAALIVRAADDSRKAETVELKLDLPKPLFAGTPKNLPDGLEPAQPTPRRPTTHNGLSMKRLAVSSPRGLSDQSDWRRLRDKLSGATNEGSSTVS